MKAWLQDSDQLFQNDGAARVLGSSRGNFISIEAINELPKDEV